jgi:hypothetical protein
VTFSPKNNTTLLSASDDTIRLYAAGDYANLASLAYVRELESRGLVAVFTLAHYGRREFGCSRV